MEHLIVFGVYQLKLASRQWLSKFDEFSLYTDSDRRVVVERAKRMRQNLHVAGRKKAAPKATKTLEHTLWDAADKMRGNLEAGEYKHVVLGLVFLKYVSGAFGERRAWLEEATAEASNEDYYVAKAELFATEEAA